MHVCCKNFVLKRVKTQKLLLFSFWYLFKVIFLNFPFWAVTWISPCQKQLFSIWLNLHKRGWCADPIHFDSRIYFMWIVIWQCSMAITWNAYITLWLILNASFSFKLKWNICSTCHSIPSPPTSCLKLLFVIVSYCLCPSSRWKNIPDDRYSTYVVCTHRWIVC